MSSYSFIVNYAGIAIESARFTLLGRRGDGSLFLCLLNNAGNKCFDGNVEYPNPDEQTN